MNTNVMVQDFYVHSYIGMKECTVDADVTTHCTRFMLCVQSSCTWGCMLIQNRLQPVLFGGHVDGREVKVGPIEVLLHSNTYMPPIVQHPGFSGYAPLHSTMPQVNPESIAEQRGAKVLLQVCSPQWDIFNLQATWQSMITNFFPLTLRSPLYSIYM